MSEHYDFHYQPTGSGAISGQQVLQQTEDAINELGDYVNNNVGGAMDVAQQALETAQNAEQDAQTALDTANSFSSAIQSAQQDASTALSTAQTAQTTASNANNTAIQAQQDASSAVTTANNASGQVSTLSGTVTTLGQRVTTAEGNIGQNTSDISSLTTRVGTAEGNITTLQNDVSVAMGNASSAIATAGTVKQQAYVLRYSSSSVTDNSTIAYSTLDNTDNIKASDKVIDVDGKIFSVVSVDTANSTFTVGSALIDLAIDGNVVHLSGDETVDGNKTFTKNVKIKNTDVTRGTTTDSGTKNITYTDSNDNELSSISVSKNSNGSTSLVFKTSSTDNTDALISSSFQFFINKNGNKVINPSTSEDIALGRSSNKWSDVVTTKVNGLTPSSLSLPSDRSARVDISGYITNLSNGGNNSYTVPANGYVWLHFTSVNNVLCFSQTSGSLTNYAQTFSRYSGDGVLYAFFPVRKDDYFIVQIYTSSTAVVQNAYFIPCQGNV